MDDTNPQLEKRTQTTKKIAKECLFSVTWLYILIKIFIVDVERYVFNRFHFEGEWVLNFRFFMLFVVGSLLWISLGNWSFLLNLSHFILYPFQWLFWRIPIFLFWRVPKLFHHQKRYVALFAYVNYLINVIWDLKKNLLTLSSFILAVVFVIYSSNQALLSISLLTFVVILLAHLYRRFNQAYSPVEIFTLNVEVLNAGNASRLMLPESLLLQESQIKSGSDLEKTRITNIEKLIFLEALLGFAKAELRSFLSRRTYMKVFAAKIALTMVLVIFLITLINICLFKISPGSFLINSDSSFFEFLNYSIYSIMPDGTDIQAKSFLAKIVRLFSSFVGIFILVILITVFFSVGGDKYKEDINGVIDFSDKQANRIQSFMMEKYSMPVEEATKELQRVESALITVIEAVQRMTQDR